MTSDFSAKRLRSSPARPREEAMPSLHVSVPGQAATSTIVPAPASLSPSDLSSLYSSTTRAWRTQRRTRFCSTVVRAGHGKQFLLGAEVHEDLGLVRNRAQAAADEQLEPALAVLDLGDSAEVVDRDQGARLVLAPGEGDLELSAEVLRVAVPEQIKR